MRSLTTVRLMDFLRYWLPVLLWAGLILAVSAVSNPFVVVPDAVQTPDETLGRYAHVAEYAVLSFLAGRALTRAGRLTGAAARAAGLGCLAFGVLDEVFQSQVPERAFQFLDLGLDGIGIVLGLLVYRMVSGR